MAFPFTMKKYFVTLSLLLILTQAFSQNKIRVALHPYIPRGDQFEKVLENHWDQLHTGVQIEFVYFNFYKEDPTDDIDLFVFDVAFLKQYQAEGRLLEIPKNQIQDSLDFLPYAWEGSRIGNQIYGLPYLGCQYVYFYHKDDKELDTPLSVKEFYKVVGPSPDSSRIPPKGQGLLLDMSEPIARAFMYLNSSMNIRDEYQVTPNLPEKDDLHSRAMHQLKLYTKMAGIHQASDSTIVMDRINWFTKGHGRAMVGWTEMLADFPPKELSKYKFRIMPLSNNRPEKYAYPLDVVVINAKIRPEMKEIAYRLQNLMASTDVLYESMIAFQHHQNPQFLVPVRNSLLMRLMAVHPLYFDIATMLKENPPAPFMLPANGKAWIKATRSEMESQLFTK